MRRPSVWPKYLAIGVSIHAPGRGATQQGKDINYDAKVSIHAPGRGATCRCVVRRFQVYRFNSRTREGCDLAGSSFFFRLMSVSIHAPGRGATQAGLVAKMTLTVSIHAPGRGATCRYWRRRRGVHSFNSRTREGCDYILAFWWVSAASVSIHAPGRGATKRHRTKEYTRLMFQFTHPGGVRLRMIRRTHSFPTRFNSRTREGCDEQYP